MAWFKRFRSGRDRAPEDAVDHRWGLDPRAVGPDDPADPAVARSASDFDDWELFDLVAEAQRLAVPGWSVRARQLGAADGQAGLPHGFEGEIPPAIAQVWHTSLAQLTLLHDAFVVRKEWLRSEVRRMRLERRGAELRYLEGIAAYNRSSVAAPLEPRYADLDEARTADTERRTARERVETRAQADLARNWFVNPVWYWLSTVVLVGAELPLSYTLANSILVEGSNGWLATAGPWMLAVSITLAILVTVKLSGTLFRRAQTLLQLRRRVAEQAAREARAPSNDRAQPPSEAEIGAYAVAGGVRLAVAGALSIVLVSTVLLLAQFRGEAFASVTQQESERALIESQDASIDDTATDATSEAEIVPVVSEQVLSNLFLGILLLSTMSGVVLAWVSTDPDKETTPRPGRKDDRWWHAWRGVAPDDKQTHRALVTHIDRLRGELLDADFSVARCEEALKQLDERGAIAHERLVTAAHVAGAEYWKANQAWRHDVLGKDYLEWLSQQLNMPPVPPPPGWSWEPPTPSDDWDPEDDS